MLVYLIATILSVLFSVFAIVEKRKYDSITYQSITIKSNSILYQKFFLFLSWLVLFLVSALRWYVGTDYSGTYMGNFYTIANGAPPYWDKGFYWLNKVIIYFTKDYAWLFAVTSLIITAIVFLAIKQYSVNIPISILMFVIGGFYFTSFNIIRQWITIAIFLYSLRFIEQKKIIKYMVCVLIAATFHLSALVYLPIYFIGAVKINFKRFLLISALAILSVPLIKPIIIFIFTNTKYVYYFNSKYNTSDATISDIIICVAILLLGYFFYPKDNDRQYDLLMNIQLAATLLALYSPLFMVSSRFPIMFTAGQIFLIPKIFKTIKNKNTMLLVSFLVILCYCMSCYYLFAIRGFSNVLPYRWIWER